jgi:hypothetical protein
LTGSCEDGIRIMLAIGSWGNFTYNQDKYAFQGCTDENEDARAKNK